MEIENGGYRVLDGTEFAAVWTSSLDQFLERGEGELDALGGYFRPLYALSLSTDWLIWNGRPWLYHIENIVWHAVVVCGLYALGDRRF